MYVADGVLLLVADVADGVLLQLERGVGDSCYKSLLSLFPTDVENSFELDK